ncbi:hypothetical protein TNCV_1480471 [Trichonephila clavipes]|nr:hypothetical protein TNCV_1480471 [Trichonephila clavipes]
MLIVQYFIERGQKSRMDLMLCTQGAEETLRLCKICQSTTSCAKHRHMSESGETNSRSIGSSDKFRASPVRRNVVNQQTS